MKRTFCAVLTLIAVFLFTGNIFAQEFAKGTGEYISKFFQTENIAERTKIVDEAIEQLPIAESYTLVFLDSMGNYITPFIEEFSVAKTQEDFRKSEGVLTMSLARLDDKVAQYNTSKTTEAANKDSIQRRILATYEDIFYLVELLFNEKAFEKASKQIYDSMDTYKKMETNATGKTTKPMPSYEEFRNKLSKQMELYKKLNPPTSKIERVNFNPVDLGLKQEKQAPMMDHMSVPHTSKIEHANFNPVDLELKQVKQAPMMDHMSVDPKNHIIKSYARIYNDKAALKFLQNKLKASESKLDKEFVEKMDKEITNRIAELEKKEKEQNEQKVKELEKSLKNQKEKGLPSRK